MTLKTTVALGLSLSLLGGLATAWYSAHLNNQLARDLLSQQASLTEQRLHWALLSVEHGLRGTRGAINAAGPAFDLSRFRAYMASRNLPHEFPGVPAFAWVEHLPAEERAERLAQAQVEQPALAWRQYQPNEGSAFMLRYIEPDSFMRASVGLDLGSEPLRRAAFERARVMNAVLLSPPLISSGHSVETTPDYLAILAVSDRGWVVAPLFLDQLLSKAGINNPLIALTLEDDQFRFDANRYTPTSGLLVPINPPRLEQNLNIYGRTLRLTIRPGPEFYKVLSPYRPTRVFALSLVAGLLLTALLALYRNYRQAAIERERGRLAQLGQLIDAAPCGMMLLDPDYQFVAVNAQLCVQTGYSRQELVGESFVRIMGETRDGQNLTLNSGKQDLPGSVDMMIRRRDGSIFPAGFGLSTLRLDGKAHIVATLEDVTERRKIERQIAESEITFRKLANAMPQQVWISDADGKLRYINERCIRFFGCELEQLRANWHAFLHPDDRERALAQWQAAHRSGREYNCEFRMRAAAGYYCWFMSRAVPITSADGSVQAWYGTNTDISQIKQTQLALTELAANNDAIVNGVLDAIITIDEDGKIINFNAAATELFGYEHAEVVGRNVRILMDEPHRSRHDGYLAHYLSTGEARVIGKGRVLDALRKDGLPFKIELRVAEIWHHNQRRFMGMVRDITERHRNEQLLRAQDYTLGLIASNTELIITLDALVREIEGITPDVKASIMLLDASGERLLHGAAPSLPSEINAAANGLTIGPNVAACGSAAFHQRDIICEDIGTDPRWETFRELALKCGLHACWSTPIFSKNRLLGTFALYWDHPTQPGEPHRRVVSMAKHVAALAIAHDQREQRIKQLAFYDTLTQLPNRALGMDRLARAISDAQRRRELLAVLFMDLDGFKAINDSLGHHVGDQLLKLAAERLSHCVRDNDTVARLGGDEFIIVLSGSNESLAEVVTQKVLDAMSQVFQVQDFSLHVSCSIGVALYPQDGNDASSLLRNADAAMYRAKELGRNNVQYYTEELNRAAMERITLESEIRLAIERQEFTLHYQPRINNITGKIIGVEALVRWQHPSRGLIGPDIFIPVAEQSGLIVPLGEWILYTACAQVAGWQALCPGLAVSVNLSPRQFMDQLLADKVRQSLTRSGLAAQLLELEITESMVMDSEAATTQQLHQLKELQATLAIDDFGTGYSNLSRLKHLPVDVIKIDKSFVDGIPADLDDVAIVTTIIAMGHHLKLKVVAEGVETFAQQTFLSEHHCDEMQGYLFGKPVDADSLEQQLRALQEAASPR